MHQHDISILFYSMHYFNILYSCHTTCFLTIFLWINLILMLLLKIYSAQDLKYCNYWLVKLLTEKTVENSYILWMTGRYDLNHPFFLNATVYVDNLHIYLKVKNVCGKNSYRLGEKKGFYISKNIFFVGK